MKFKCPSCGSDLCIFTMLYMTTNFMPFKKYRCQKCGERFKARITGPMRSLSHYLGVLVGFLAAAAYKGHLPAWWLAGIPLAAGIDVLIIFKNRNLIRFVPITPNKPDATTENDRTQSLM